MSRTSDNPHPRPSNTADGSPRRSGTRRPAGGAHMAGSSSSPTRRPPQGGSPRNRQAPPQQRQRSAQGRPRTQQAPQSRRTYREHQQTRRKKSPVVPIIVGVLVLALVGVGGFFLFRFFTSFKVTVNGQEVTMHRGDTVEQLLDAGYATPKAGNLLAVDGSLLTEGEGERCTVTINGNAASINSELTGDIVVDITDGGDTTEEATETEEAIPFTRSSDDTGFSSYWTGSIHLLSDGEDGVRLTRTGKVSGKTVEEVVKEPINAGYHIYTAKPEDKAVALTFDDGPWPETTDAILDILEQYGAKATFFAIGNQMSSHAATVKRAYDMGCQICTHSWDHAEGSGQGVSLALMSASEQVNEVTKGYKAIADIIGTEPDHVMRAPGGNFYDDVITNLWDYVDAEIGWDVDTEDWRRPGVDSILQMILSVQPGQVVLMHDGGGDRSQTVEALREAMPVLVEQGYSFVTVNDLLALGLPTSGGLNSIPSTTDSAGAASGTASAA